jgi:hypothetical protein
VNIGGLFVLSKWILPNFIDWEGTGITDHLSFSQKCAGLGLCDKLTALQESWYEQTDFDQMSAYGLNAVRVSVGYWYFEELSGVAATPYLKPTQSISAEDHPLTKIVRYASVAGLKVILNLETVTTEGSAVITSVTAKALGTYVTNLNTQFGLDNVILAEVGTAGDIVDTDSVVNSAIAGLRSSAPGLPISFVESSADSAAKAEDVFINTKVYHGETVADIASDTAAADREKMFAHEKIACGFKAPLHFTTCTRRPTYVGEFSLATENCLKNVDVNYQDYGQCNRIATRAASPWWQRHTKSFAMRQIATYERELGWAFQTYKLDDAAEAADPSAVYWSFRLAVEAGLIDLLTEAPDACLHKPASDYALGDDTYAPTPAPQFWIPPQYLPKPVGTDSSDGESGSADASAPYEGPAVTYPGNRAGNSGYSNGFVAGKSGAFAPDRMINTDGTASTSTSTAGWFVRSFMTLCVLAAAAYGVLFVVKHRQSASAGGSGYESIPTDTFSYQSAGKVSIEPSTLRGASENAVGAPIAVNALYAHTHPSNWA